MCLNLWYDRSTIEPTFHIGICRIVDIALAKIIAEDKATGKNASHDWLNPDS